MWLPARRPLLTDALLKERRDARKREDAKVLDSFSPSSPSSIEKRVLKR